MTLFQRRAQQAELLIIGALVEGELSGFLIHQRTGLNPGRMHVALARLEGTGRVASRWADGPYPRRRLYRLAEQNVEDLAGRIVRAGFDVTITPRADMRPIPCPASLSGDCLSMTEGYATCEPDECVHHESGGRPVTPASHQARLAEEA